MAPVSFSIRLTSAVGFFLLFPGYVFYHYLLGRNLIPPFAAGLYGYVSLGVFLAFLALFACDAAQLKKIVENPFALFVVAFLCYTSAWTIAHYVLFADDARMAAASRQAAATALFWTSLFLIGLTLPLESKVLKWSLFASFIVIFAYLLQYCLSTGEVSYPFRWIHRDSKHFISSHQGISRGILLSLLFLLATAKWNWRRFFLVLAGVFVLFAASGRAGFIGFLALLILLEALVLSRGMGRLTQSCLQRFPALRSMKILGRLLPVLLLLLAIFALVKTELPSEWRYKIVAVDRQMEIFDLSSSRSWIVRQFLNRIALDQIAENPLLGRFGGHIPAEPVEGEFKVGWYAHNVLSAWVSYGLVGFLMYVCLVAGAFLLSARYYVLRRRDAPLWAFAFMLNFVCLLLVALAKAVFWALPALGWGVVVQALLAEGPQRRVSWEWLGRFAARLRPAR